MILVRCIQFPKNVPLLFLAPLGDFYFVSKLSAQEFSLTDYVSVPPLFELSPRQKVEVGERLQGVALGR